MFIHGSGFRHSWLLPTQLLVRGGAHIVPVGDVTADDESI
jgi:hypothetical protein